jgi:hypothetical protein
MAVADFAGPLVAPPIAAAVAVTTFAGVGVVTAVATAIAATTGCAVLAAALAAAAAAAVSVVAVPLSSPLLPLADDVLAGAAGAVDWVWLGSAGGAAPMVAVGFPWELELVGPFGAFVFIVELLAGCGPALVPAEALWAALPLFAAGELFAPLCGVAGAVLLLCVAAGFELGLGADGWEEETWLCEDVPLALIGSGFIGAGLAACGGFASADAVSGAVLVASSKAANGLESDSSAGVGVGDRCDCTNDDVELTSDAILATA